MSDLLDSLDWTDALAWTPIYQHEKPPFERKGFIYDCTRAEWNRWLDSVSWCRDCGCRAGNNQGGTNFVLCDDCAQLDGCLERQHDLGADVHVSHWGAIHPASRHDAHVKAQARRRALWRAKHEPSERE